MKNWKVWATVIIVVGWLILGGILAVIVFIPQRGDDFAAGL